jgi:hypothetical protein
LRQEQTFASDFCFLDLRIFFVWGRSGVLHTVQQAIENQHLDLESERSAQENQKIQAAGAI